MFMTHAIILGRYTRGITNYELTVPHKVHSDETMKRNAVISYNIFFDDENRLIELLPNHVNFISPAIIREHLHGDKILKRQVGQVSSMCHYIGHIQGVDDSRVALSNCDGVASILSHEREF
jgi:Reprolysin family propeptide